MAFVLSFYDHNARRFMNGDWDLDNLKVMLLDDTPSFDGAHTTLDEVAGAESGSPAERPNEVYGNGWTQGGEDLANVDVSTVNTNDAALDADDIEVTATGGDIGPAHAAVIYDDTDGDNAPMAFIAFDPSQTAGDTTDFVIRWHADGILVGSYTAPS